MIQSRLGLLVVEKQIFESASLDRVVHLVNHFTDLSLLRLKVGRERVDVLSMISHVMDFLVQHSEAFLVHKAAQVVLLSVVIGVLEVHRWVITVCLIIHLL